MQAALHQRRDLAGAGGHGGLQRRVLGAVGGDDPALGDVELRAVGDPADLGLGAEQHRHDQPGLGRLHRAGQRLGAARVHHAGQHRLEAAGSARAAHPADAPPPRAAAASSAPAPPAPRSRRACPAGSVHCAVEYDEPPDPPASPAPPACAVSTASIGSGGTASAPRSSGSTIPGPGRADPTSAVRIAVTMPAAPWHVAGRGEQSGIAEGGGPGAHVARLQGALQRRGVAEL